MWKYSMNTRYCISCEYAVKRHGGGYYKDLILYYCNRLPCTIDIDNEYSPYTRVLGHGKDITNSIRTFSSPKCPLTSHTHLV